MTARLPTPGGDDNQWGDVLNNFLGVSLNSDGTLSNNTVGTSQIQSGAVTNAQLDTPTQSAIAKANSSVQTVNGKTPTSGAVTLTASDVSAIPSSQLGVASGVATLDGSSQLTSSQIPGSVVTVSSGTPVSGQVPVFTGTGDAATPQTAATSYNSTPNPDTSAGAAGSSATFARGDHSHPLSSLYDQAGLDLLNTVGSSGSTVTIPSVGSAQSNFITLTTNCTLIFPTAVAGARFRLSLKQDSTGSRAPTFPGSVAWAGGSAPTWSTSSGLIDVVYFVCLDGSSWIGLVEALGIVTSSAPLSIIQSVNTNAPWSGTITFPNNVTVGSGILALVAGGSSTLTPSGGGCTWTRLDNGSQLGSAQSASQTCPAQVWLGTGSTGGSGTAAITFANTVAVGELFEISNAVLVSGSVTAGSGNASSSVPFTTPTLTASAAAQMPWVVMAMNEFRAAGTDPSSPWVAGQTHDVNGGSGYPTGGPSYTFQYAYQASTSNGGNYSTTWTPPFSTSYPWTSLSFFLKHS